MQGAILVLTSPEGQFLTPQIGLSVEPFYAMATKIVKTGKLGKEAVKEGQIIRLSDGALIKHFRV